MKGVSFFGLVLLGSAMACRRAPAPPAPLEKVDVHTHLGPGSLWHALPALEAQGIRTVVNLSGGAPGRGLEQQLAAAQQYPGRVVVFCTPNLAAGGRAAAAELEQMHSMGCRGLKIFKALGLMLRNRDGQLIAVDDPDLDPLFETAGRLKMPAAIHTGDPKAFWLPVTPENERHEELTVHPDWSLAGQAVPSWEALLAQFERRVARHPGTTFIGLHFGNAAEEPLRVAQMLERYPNLWVETGARIPELGRGDPTVLRDVFLKYQDRILFGTDAAAFDQPGQWVLGSPGRAPPSPEEIARFWNSTWRFFESDDRSFPNPTAIQGGWSISGIALPRDVLKKVYGENARRLLAQ